MRGRSADPGPRDAATAVLAGLSRLPGLDGRLLVVGGGKGGTGKSVVTANLGVLGSMRGREVVLVDADLGLANLHLLLGVDTDGNILSLLERGGGGRPLLKPGPAGVRLLAGASGVGRLAGLNRAELRRLLERLEPYFQQGELILIDLSSGISPSTRLFLEAAHEVVLVTNPEPSAMLDAYGVIKLLVESSHSSEIHLIVNRARDIEHGQECGQRIVLTAQRFLHRDVSLLGCIPEDELMRASAEGGRPLVLDRPQSPAALALSAVAERLFQRRLPPGNTAAMFVAAARRLLAPRRGSTRAPCA